MSLRPDGTSDFFIQVGLRPAERYAAGETLAELARDYRCGEATIWRALQA